MMTLTIADPEKKGISEYLKTLPSRNPVGCPAGPIPGIGSGYMQVSLEKKSLYQKTIMTTYFRMEWSTPHHMTILFIQTI